MALQCRTCGSIIYNKMPKNLFHIENEKMLQDINLVTGTTLHNDPELPSSICACCTLDLNQAILFRERCILTQEQLVHQRRSPEAKEPAEDVEEMASPPDCLDDPFGEVDEYIVESPEEILDRDSDAHHDLDEDHYIDSVEDVDALQDMAEGQLKVAEEDSQDVESLVSSVQKELESIYNDDSNSDNNEVLEAKNGSYFNETMNECEVSSNPNTPLPELKSAAGRSTKPATTKPKRKKQYVTWKNMTEEQIIERKRLQRKRECVCEQCGRQFTDQSNFKLHMLRHTGNKNFACQQCGKRFYTDHLMTLHQRIIHQGEKPYDCRFCTMSFHNSNTRLIHERTHTNAKPYSCHHCDKCFKSASGRKRHELIHTGVRAFACTICKQSFQRNTHLKAHLRSKFHTAKARTMGAEVLQL